jgi:hypothetical protein
MPFDESEAAVQGQLPAYAEVAHQRIAAALVAPEQAVAAGLEGASVEQAAREDLVDRRLAPGEEAVHMRERLGELPRVHHQPVGSDLVAAADVGQRPPADEGRAFEHEHALAVIFREQRRDAQAGDAGADDDCVELVVAGHHGLSVS